MSLQPINCSSCLSYLPCYHVCCMVTFLCRDCLMDSDILAANNQCPQCYRELGVIYRSLVMEATCGQGNNKIGSKPFVNNGQRQSQPFHQNQIMRGQTNFVQEEEEEFEFAETLKKKKSQVKKIRNNFSSFLNDTSTHCQQDPHQGNLNKSLTKNSVPQQFMGQGSAPFSPRNTFVSKPFNNTMNNGFNPQGCSYETPYQGNLGFNHQNEMYMNNGYNGNPYKQTNGFNQNIRQSKPFNQNMYPNNFNENAQYHQGGNYGQGNMNGNMFNQFNQQRANTNMHQNFSGNSFESGQRYPLNQSNFSQNPFSTQPYQHSNSNFPFQSTQQPFSQPFQQSFHSTERSTKSVDKVHQLKRVISSNNPKSTSFKLDNKANHSPSDKEHSPSFGIEYRDESLGIVPYGGNTHGGNGNHVQGGHHAMELEQGGDNNGNRTMGKTRSVDSLVTLGSRNNNNTGGDFEI